MQWFFDVIRYFPWLAIPSVIILGGVAAHFRRRNKRAQWTYFALAGTLSLFCLLWFVFRGDQNADRWIRALQGRS